MESSPDAASNLKQNSAFEEDIEESSVEHHKEDKKEIIDHSDQNGNNCANNKSKGKNDYLSIKQLPSFNNCRNKKICKNKQEKDSTINNVNKNDYTINKNKKNTKNLNF